MGRHMAQNFLSVWFSVATELADSISAGCFPHAKAGRAHHGLSVPAAERLVVYPLEKGATSSISCLLSPKLFPDP